jgi:predicted metal-binding membrane protein
MSVLGTAAADQLATAGGGDRRELAQAFAAARSRLGLIALLLLVLAGLAWWLTAGQMAGMSSAPGGDIGTLAWFIGVWVMMAAMMLPSLAPTTALYAKLTRQRATAAVHERLPAGLGRSGRRRLWPLPPGPIAVRHLACVDRRRALVRSWGDRARGCV